MIEYHSRAKDLRIKCALSMTEAAALAKVSPHTWKLFEIDADLVTKPKRESCNAALAQLESMARKQDQGKR